MRNLSLCLGAIVSLAQPALAQNDTIVANKIVGLGREYTAWYFDGRIGELYAKFSPDMRNALDSAHLAASRQQVQDQLGQDRGMITEATSPRPPYTIYDQMISVEKIAQPVVIRWAIDTSGTIGGFFVKPAEASEAISNFLDYKTKTVLRLPFAGEWLVLWGGRSLAQNRHAASPDQRFGYDFIAAQGGVTHRGDGKQNADYFDYGRPIVAPGAGTVVDVVDSIADNAPGSLNARNPLGNYMVIDHGNGEFSFLAHLQRGSLKVKTGDHVAAGAELGKCGNSGNSSEPHLHYHMQTTPSYLVGAGMPAQFEHYVADGAAVPRGEPTRGQTIHAGS